MTPDSAFSRHIDISDELNNDARKQRCSMRLSSRTGSDAILPVNKQNIWRQVKWLKSCVPKLPQLLSQKLSTAVKKYSPLPPIKQNPSMHSEALKLCAADHCFLRGVRGDNSVRANNVLNWPAIACSALPVQVKLECWWAAVRKTCNWSPLHH